MRRAWPISARRLGAAITLAYLAALVGLVFATRWGEAVIAPDTLNDLLLARDALDGLHVQTRGPISGSLDLSQGATWVHWNVLAGRLGLDIGLRQRVLALSWVSAVLIYFWGLRRRWGTQGAFPAAVTFVWALSWLVPFEIYWGPSPMPLIAVFLALAADRQPRGTGRWSAFSLGVFLAVAVDVHLIAVPLLVPALFSVGWRAQRPLAAAFALLAGLFAYLAVSSSAALISNLRRLWEAGALLPAVALCALALFAGREAGRRWPRIADSTRALVVSAGVGLALAGVWLLAEPVMGRSMAGRYAAPFIPWALMALPSATTASIGRLSRP